MPFTSPSLRRLPGAARLLAGLAGLGLAAAAAAALAAGGTPQIFRQADLAQGEALIRQHRCSECHARRVGGDGSLMYRPFERLHDAGALRGMVEACNTELGLQMFPDEVTAVAAVLNRDHYRFER